MKEPTERTGTKEPIQQTRVTETSATTRWIVVVLLTIAALIILLPLRNLAGDHLTARIILSTIVLGICGAIAIWHKPTD
jgi:hypothetical protein